MAHQALEDSEHQQAAQTPLHQPRVQDHERESAGSQAHDVQDPSGHVHDPSGNFAEPYEEGRAHVRIDNTTRVAVREDSQLARIEGLQPCDVSNDGESKHEHHSSRRVREHMSSTYMQEIRSLENQVKELSQEMEVLKDYFRLKELVSSNTPEHNTFDVFEVMLARMGITQPREYARSYLISKGGVINPPEICTDATEKQKKLERLHHLQDSELAHDKEHKASRPTKENRSDVQIEKRKRGSTLHDEDEDEKKRPKLRECKLGSNNIKFDEFDGARDVHKAISFIAQYDVAFEYGNYSESSMLRHVGMHLKGPAQIWWWAQIACRTNACTWKAFKRQFYEYFLPVTFKAETLSEWYRFSQDVGDSVAFYVERFYQVLQKMITFKPVCEEEQKRVFESGLHDFIKRNPVLNRNSNMGQLISSALSIEESHLQEAKRRQWFLANKGKHRAHTKKNGRHPLCLGVRMIKKEPNTA